MGLDSKERVVSMKFKLGSCIVTCVGLLCACSSSSGGGNGGGTSGTGSGGPQASTGGQTGAAGGAATSTAGKSGASGMTASSGGTGGASSAAGTSGGGNGGGNAAAGKGGAGGAGSGGASAAGSGGAGGSQSAGALTLQSVAFKDATKIDAKYRCTGPSPDLSWSGAASGTMSYALVLKDVTPGFSQGFLHWIIYDIPKSTTSLPENVPVGYMPASPAGAHQAPAYNGTAGFNGPCGGMNTYELTLYAIDVATLPGLSMSSAGADVVTAIDAHKVGTSKLTVMSAP